MFLVLIVRPCQVFVGQIMGTAVGTKVFVTYGWRPAAALSVGWTAFTLIVMLVRGPHCARHTWFGYEGGMRMRKDVPAETPRVVLPLSCEPNGEIRKTIEIRTSLEKNERDGRDEEKTTIV